MKVGLYRHRVTCGKPLGLEVFLRISMTPQPMSPRYSTQHSLEFHYSIHDP